MRYSWAAWRLFSSSIGVFSVVLVLVFMVYMLHGVVVVVQLLRGLGVSFLGCMFDCLYFYSVYAWF